MLKSKQIQLTRSETIQLLQSANMKSLFIIEPYEESDQRGLTDLVKKHRNDTVSIIVCVHR